MFNRLQSILLKETSPTSAKLFYFLIGLAALTRVGSDIYVGVWEVHAGKLFPNRTFVPDSWIYPVWALSLEWMALSLGAIGLALGVHRHRSAILAFLGALASLIERYQSQKALLVLIFGYLCLDCPDPDERSPEAAPQLGFALIRFQLFALYWTSYLIKMRDRFFTGDSLSALLEQVSSMKSGAILPSSVLQWLADPGISQALSIGVLAAEALIPLLLVTRPFLGIAAAVLLHVSFSICVPNTWAFTAATLSMAVLFWDPSAKASS